MRKIIYLCLAMLFSSCYQSSDPYDLYLNENQKGWVAIIFNCNEGQKKKEKDGKVQINIPKNGISLNAFPRKFGVISEESIIFHLGDSIEGFGFRDQKFDLLIHDYFSYGTTGKNNRKYNCIIFNVHGDTLTETRTVFENKIYDLIQNDSNWN